MKKTDWLAAALLAAAALAANCAFAQSNVRYMNAPMNGRFADDAAFHSGAASQQTYVAPSANYCDSCDSCDFGFVMGDEGVGGSAPGFFIGAEWLAWQVSGASQTYASAVDPVYLTERYNKDASPNGYGVRGKIGYRTASMWDFAVGYTYFNADDSGAIGADTDPSSVFVSTRSRLNLESQNVDFNDEIELNVIDFEVGRKLQYGNFDVRPFGGFRWLELDSDQSGGYEYALAGYAPNRLATNAIGSESSLKAYGLRMGAEAGVDFAGCLRAFGRGAASVMAGDVKSQAYENDATQGTVLNRNYKETIAVPTLEVAAGLALKLDMLEIKGGYELNTIFNGANHNGTRDDVLFHGFFAGASLNY